MNDILATTQGQEVAAAYNLFNTWKGLCYQIVEHAALLSTSIGTPFVLFPLALELGTRPVEMDSMLGTKTDYAEMEKYGWSHHSACLWWVLYRGGVKVS